MGFGSMTNKNEMGADELIAMMAHSDLKDGEMIIKLGGRWITANIHNLEVATEVGCVPTFKIEGSCAWQPETKKRNY